MTRGTSSPRRSVEGSARHGKPSRGQSLVEFAIFIPVLVVVLLLAVDVGRVYLGWVSLTNVARIGANFAAQNPNAWNGGGNTTIQARYQTLMAKDATDIDCTLPSTLPAPTFVDSSYDLGSRVKVNLTCTFPLVTPLLTNLIGDGAGNINVASAAVFTIRSGSVGGLAISGGVPAPRPTATPTPAPTATPTSAPTATPAPTPSGTGPTPTPGPSATPTPEPRVVTFWGSSTSTDASGGGTPGSIDENQILGIVTLNILFNDTSTGPPKSVCLWNFGDGDTATTCGNQVSHTYSTRGTFTVSLTIDGVTHTRTDYVLVGCKVPAFAGVHRDSAVTNWINAGFASGNMSYLDGNGNYKVDYQSLVGGLVNPQGGCSDATITVGP